jgi:hypothetical protein
MEISRRALYNLIRMNWINDPTTDCERWQVEDYRALNTDELFLGLQRLGIPWDPETFALYAFSVESPEELTDLLLKETDLEPMEQDRIYLFLFEIWRRLLPEKICLSIFCDELDHQIFMYDKGDVTAAESIQDAIANLQDLLDDNVDEGVGQQTVFQTVSAACANDLESFLYDYIAEQIDNGDVLYASELLDDFDTYISNSKWFDLLKIRILELEDPEKSQDALKKLVNKAIREKELTFNLEVLSFISQCGDKKDFNKMVRQSVPLLGTEEDFKELLKICEDYYRCLDEDCKERAVQKILNARLCLNPENKLKKNDPNLETLLELIK